MSSSYVYAVQEVTFDKTLIINYGKLTIYSSFKSFLALHVSQFISHESQLVLISYETLVCHVFVLELTRF